MASYFAKLCRLRHVVLVFIICSVDIPGKDIGGVFLEMWFRKLHDVSAHNLVSVKSNVCIFQLPLYCLCLHLCFYLSMFFRHAPHGMELVMMQMCPHHY
uniref:Uncharacterized protein n=1 Tax=Aegilops tauschii subsp. strangulata TaxID=200361 RepID=A0A453PV02_AEGTS